MFPGPSSRPSRRTGAPRAAEHLSRLRRARCSLSERDTPPQECGAHPPRRRRTRRGGWRRHVGTSLLAAVLAVIVGIGVLAIMVPCRHRVERADRAHLVDGTPLPPGTMVVVRPTDPADIEPSMVVTYQLKSGEAAVVTHRVTQSLLTADGERVFTTQGDADPSADIDPVRGVQIRGTVWYAIPCVGWAPWSFRVSSSGSSSRSPWWHSSATPPGPSSRRSSTKHAPPHTRRRPWQCFG